MLPAVDDGVLWCPFLPKFHARESEGPLRNKLTGKMKEMKISKKEYWQAC
jgi:hypothetical protein